MKPKKLTKKNISFVNGCCLVECYLCLDNRGNYFFKKCIALVNKTLHCRCAVSDNELLHMTDLLSKHLSIQQHNSS